MPTSVVTRGILAALAGALSFAAGAPLVRIASRGMSPETLTALRMLLAAITIFLLAFFRRRSLAVPAHRRRAVAAVALVCFVHFYSFIAALYFTSPLRCLALTYLAPVWTFLAWLFLGGRRASEPVFSRLAAILLALSGVALLLVSGPSGLSRLQPGDLYALISGLALSAYHYLGGRIRRDTPLLAYAGWVYLGSALPFLPLFACGAWRLDLSQSFPLLALLGVAILPTVGGHTLINYSLQSIPAPLVSLIATLEVPGGALLAALFTGDRPLAMEWLAAGFSLGGLLLYYSEEGRYGEGRTTTPAAGFFSAPVHGTIPSRR